MNKTEHEPRILALAKHLDEDPSEIEGTESLYDDCLFELGAREYLVLTDEEADEKVKECIKGSLWAFNSSFLASFTDLPEEVFTALQPQCENANEAILRIIEQGDGLDAFVEEAVSCDGRGHFINHYDGCEDEIVIDDEYFYVYRTN